MSPNALKKPKLQAVTAYAFSGQNALITAVPEIEKQVETQFLNGVAEQIKQTCPEIERRSHLSAEEFKIEYRDKNRPVIIESFISDWNCYKNWSMDYLAKKCGDVKVSLGYSSEDRRVVTIKEYADLLKQGVNGKPLYLGSWDCVHDCPDLAKDFGDLSISNYDYRPQLYGEKEEIKYRVVWIGQKGAVTEMHREAMATDVLHIQVTGEKHWTIFEPEAYVKIDDSGNVDLQSFAKKPNAKIWHCTLKPGDFIFLPCGWYHRVALLKDSISLSFQSLDQKNMGKHMHVLMQEMLPVILNGEYIRKTYPDRYEYMIPRWTRLAKAMGIDLTRFR